MTPPTMTPSRLRITLLVQSFTSIINVSSIPKPNTEYSPCTPLLPQYHITSDLCTSTNRASLEASESRVIAVHVDCEVMIMKR
jgi:hypothetical protein